MKLRNKNTVEIFDCRVEVKQWKDEDFHMLDIYASIEDLRENWEDCEPLIKDEKIRKALRSWAESNNFSEEIKVESLSAGTRFTDEHFGIEFLGLFLTI